MQSSGVISLILPVHILAGTLALVFGYIALAGAKGATVHRQSGIGFVAAMVALSLSGAVIAGFNAEPVSVIAGLQTFYLVTTSLRTVRKDRVAPGRFDEFAMMLALVVSAFAFVTGAGLAGRGRPEAAPIFIFGIVGVLAAIGDRRMIRAGGIQGSRRIARHLWRMCFAMWVAAASFFWGPAGRVPDVIDHPLLETPAVLIPIVMMVYWLVRLRTRVRPALAVDLES